MWVWAMDGRPCFDDQLSFAVHGLMHTKTPDGEAEGFQMLRSVGVRVVLYQTFKDFGVVISEW
jgi:hypothetical protein